MKYRAFLASVAIVVICLVLLAACNQTKDTTETAGETGILLGFSQLGSESGWRIGNTKSIQEAAERAGVQLMYENAEQKQENQIKAIRSFIAYQVDVIAFAPIVEDGWDNVLTEAKNAGIPVLITDRRINTDDENLYAGFVGSDFEAEGVSAGEFLLQKMKDAEHVNIVEISGTIDSTPTRQRASGFRSMIADDDRFTIIESISGDFLRSKGKECMQALLSEHDDIDVLYSHNDSMTYGAIEAIEEAGLIPGEDIVIITVDGEQEAIDLLMEGKINCVVECTPLIGDSIMELAEKLAAGEEIPRNTYSVERTFTEFDDDLDALPPREY
ncbi:MAG TPA: ABC transporter substrate-binding protein [Candidatus Limiplasma sp.]|nr:ABC transporter substrate-binding protein [Candidatus Limiplasma sp.]